MLAVLDRRRRRNGARVDCRRNAGDRLPGSRHRHLRWIIPCSGAVLAPRVVLTAGHCRSATKTYAVAAPNAGNQQSTASSDWTTYNGDPATSSDTLLLFLDTPIVLTSYPQIASEPVAICG